MAWPCMQQGVIQDMVGNTSFRGKQIQDEVSIIIIQSAGTKLRCSKPVKIWCITKHNAALHNFLIIKTFFSFTHHVQTTHSEFQICLPTLNSKISADQPTCDHNIQVTPTF